MRAFEDLTPGTSFIAGPIHVSAEDIVAFARAYDPQPFHLDDEQARETLLGGLAASGWHTCALLMRLLADGILAGSTGMGSPGVDECKWLKPVRPGDALTLHATVTEARASRSRPEMGLVRFEFRLANQKAETVMTMSNLIMFGRRPIAMVGAI